MPNGRGERSPITRNPRVQAEYLQQQVDCERTRQDDPEPEAQHWQEPKTPLPRGVRTYERGAGVALLTVT